MNTLTRDEWAKEGTRRFGPDMMTWRFVCPSCGHVAAAADWKAAGAPEGAVAFSCVGRWMEERGKAFVKDGGPCDYAGGGLFSINPVEVEDGRYFAFAESGPVSEANEGQQ